VIAPDGQRSRCANGARDRFAPNAIAPRWPSGRPLSLFRRRAPRDRKGDNSIAG
jgi:hypothetical protein